MILIFDLDDTLYLERDFVDSGFRAVACWLQSHYGWDAEDSFTMMCGILESEGRGKVFDRFLESKKKRTAILVRNCLQVYRMHMPKISLFSAAKRTIAASRWHSYLVTDGNKVVQQNKIAALGIESDFRKVFITHRYGIRNAKPSTYCFDLIRRREQCDWRDMAYIGDNPAKDFVNLNPLGVMTIRVLTGEHKDVKALDGYEASHVIETLDELPKII
jgi:putative hydrolase of the HAD superfamily